ncbi:unnamed protein product [Lactuca saligna]|uniref:Uncharacterized protein n=1 Tax=Lactuca saligna TaxID=75948 RepID=A0AA35Z1Y6_LACSI|nr:unnamed protein product [Lactuca saligna]
MDLDFNFSKFVFNEMKSNLEWKKKDVFLMYPRFLQMIIDDQHLDLERTVETLDTQSLGPKSFGLTKQNRKGSKIVFRGTNPLVKFGKFAENEEASVFQNIPNVEPENAPVAEAGSIHVPEPEVVFDVIPRVATMMEEHVPVLNDDDDDDDDDREGDDEEGEARCLNDEDFMFDFELSDDQRRSFLKFHKVDDVVSSPTETRGDINIFKLLLQTPAHMAERPSFSQESFEPGSSSDPSSYSVPLAAHDAISERHARFLARENVNPAPNGKGISTGAWISDDEYQTIVELKE